MAKQAELAVSPREITGKTTKQLRRVGIIPANIFGRGEESRAVQLEERAFVELRRAHQTTGVVTLKITGDKKTQTALVRHVQRDPLSGKILHINFLRVSPRDRITAKVPLHLEGIASGVKNEDGVLLHLLDSLEVECAASDIVEFIEVNISTLEHIDDTIHAKDIKLPANYVLVTDPEEAMVKVMPPRIEKAEETAETLAATAAESPAQETPAKTTEA